MLKQDLDRAIDITSFPNSAFEIQEGSQRRYLFLPGKQYT